MNKAQFEIWRKKKIAERDLELGGSNYMTVQSIFYKEDNIRAKYDQEIALMELMVEEEELQKIAWVPNGNWRPILLSAGLTIATGVVLYYLTN